MRIKTFQGRTLEAVLPEIRAELGPSAVVVGQRTKVQGGVAGFFGTKVIEVTAADRMPSDDQLVDLEDRLMGRDAGEQGSGREHDSSSRDDELAERFAGAMRMGRRGGLDVVDDWDPAQDAELAQEYGKVLEHAAAAGFTELDVPVVDRTGAVVAPTPPVSHAPAPDPMVQAQQLADRAHLAMQEAATRVDEAAYAPQMTATAAMTYAPPQALPRDVPAEAQTFGATVQDTPMQDFTPAAVQPGQSPAIAVEEALREDLALPTNSIDAAVEMIDRRAQEALRTAATATRRMKDPVVVTPARRSVGEMADDLLAITRHCSAVGVDDDIVAALTYAVQTHHMPFARDADSIDIVRAAMEEMLPVRTGFPQIGRTFRLALVGASSSGKTTVAAKLAAGYAAAGMRVGILSLVDSAPHLALQGEQRFQGLDVDVRYAATPEQAMHGMEQLSGHHLVIVDTPGAAYLDPMAHAQLRSCLAAIDVDDMHVVVPLATSSREAAAHVEAFRPVGANRLIVSRLDESRYVGQLLNFGFRLGVPMTYLSDGPQIPGHLQAACAREIAARILPATTTVSA